MTDRVQRTVLAILSLGLVTICPAAALGGVVVGLNNEGSTTLHEIEVRPGETFSVDVNLVTDRRLFWLRFAVEASASYVFSVEKLEDVVPWGSRGLHPILGGLNPRSGNQTAAVPFPTYFGPGAGTLATLSIRVEPASEQGTYLIDVFDSVYMFDRMAPAQGSAVPGSNLIVHIVPEPATVLLCIVPTVSLVRRRSRTRGTKED